MRYPVLKAGMFAAALIFSILPEAQASTIELTSRPANADIVDWVQFGFTSQFITAPPSFTRAIAESW